MNGIAYKCAVCGNLILSPNRKKRYCSEECAKEAQRAYCREYARRRWREHHEEEKANATEWRKENRERYNAYQREYYRRKKDEFNLPKE